MNKQIEEMVKVLVEGHHKMDVAWTNHFVDGERFPKPKGEHQILAEELYNAGYRKTEDVAAEIFAEIEKCFFEELVGQTEAKLLDEEMFTELKKKYESEGVE